MKLYLLLIEIIPIFCMCYSCSNAKPDGVDFTEESFRKTFHLTKGNIYKNDSLFIQMPTYLQFHPDSFLILEDMSTSKQVKIIDLKNNKIQEIISKGNGPGEMIAAYEMQILGKDLYVFCGQLRKIIKLSPDSNRQFKITEEFSLEENQTMGFYPLNKDMFVCLSNLGDDKRLTFLDNKGKIIKKLGDYPPLQTSKNIHGDNDIFGSYISATPSGNKIILACAYTDLFEIYDMNKLIINRYQGPLGIQLTVHQRNIGATGWMNQREPSYLTYCKVDACENEFWTGYIGFKEDRRKRSLISEVYPKRIFCFNWQCKPIRKIELDYPFTAFDVDWVGKVLYTLEWKNENPEIVSYSLNDILR